MQRLKFTLTVILDGNHAADVADDLAIDAEAGELDQAITNLLRAHLANHGDTRDWRIVRAGVDVPGEVNAMTTDSTRVWQWLTLGMFVMVAVLILVLVAVVGGAL